MEAQWSSGIASRLGSEACSFSSQHAGLSSYTIPSSQSNLSANKLLSFVFLHSPMYTSRSAHSDCGFKVQRAFQANIFRKGSEDAPSSLGGRGRSHFCGSVKRIFHVNHDVWQSRSNQRPTTFSSFSHICRASGQGSTGQSLPEEDPDHVQDPRAPKADGRTSPGDDTPDQYPLEADWRAFRARLVAGEQAVSNPVGADDPGGAAAASTTGESWAHPLHVPEAGCVLVATEKLDGQVNFERTVILLLRVGSNQPREGPFGIILNRSILQTINELKPTNRTLANIFGDCQLYYGGPLESDMFLLMREGGGVKHFEEVIPGVYYGGSDGLQHAADMVREKAVLPQDFRFYVGYAGWGLDQLMSEIATGLWCVAACSADLITAASTDRLWEEILLLMGGQYADLSRKPKGDGF